MTEEPKRILHFNLFQIGFGEWFFQPIQLSVNSEYISFNLLTVFTNKGRSLISLEFDTRYGNPPLLEVAGRSLI